MPAAVSLKVLWTGVIPDYTGEIPYGAQTQPSCFSTGTKVCVVKKKEEEEEEEEAKRRAGRRSEVSLLIQLALVCISVIVQWTTQAVAVGLY